MDSEDILLYYKKPMVRKEIYEYSLNRWVASESKLNGKRVFIRYWWKNGPPLSFNSISSIDRFFYRFNRIAPRTFYASVNVYSKLTDKEDISNIDNIISSTPIWDVDGDISYYEYVIEAAKIIIEELQKYGLYESVYLIWSGRGIHIHINEKAFSQDILSRYHPLDISYAAVEFILRKTRKKLIDLFDKVKESKREFKVENKIDIQRVFTVPLSLHRILDVSAVCFKPEELDEFNLSWIDPERFRHNPKWKLYIEGEADDLAEIAVKNIGGYVSRLKLGGMKKGGSVIKTFGDKFPVVKGRFGRFQVMALLQAARYYLLSRDKEKAYSFGLNRAIFYAWAKHYKVRRMERKEIKAREKHVEKYEVESLGDEQVYVSPSGMFIIGDKEQTPDDYKRQVIRKISLIIPYELAWDAAINYLNSLPKSLLLSQKEFYEKAYLPIRDSFEKIVQDHISTITYNNLKRKRDRY